VAVGSVVLSISQPDLTPGDTAVVLAVVRSTTGAALAGRQVQWVSESPTTVSVDQRGVVTALRPGNAIITGSVDGVAGRLSITVIPAQVGSVTLQLPSGSMEQGAVQLAMAAVTDVRGRPLAGRQSRWRSTSPQVAAIDDSGRIVALSPGTTTIAVTVETKSAEAPLTVTLAKVANVSVSLAETRVSVGARTTATAILRDARNVALTGRRVAWSSSAPAVATVDSTGRITAIAVGAVNILAAAEGVTGTAALTVTTPTFSVLAVGDVVEGERVELRGTGLQTISAVTLDGISAPFTVTADSVAIFTAPRVRACETDGRAVVLTVRGSSLVSRTVQLRAARRVRMQAGQSFLLRADTLSCLQLPAGDHDYVLSALNPEVPEERTATSEWPPPLVELLRFRTNPGAPVASVVLPRSRDAEPERSLPEGDPVVALGLQHLAQPATYADNPIPFDARYATAGVGDTVRFPVRRLVTCSDNRAAVFADSVRSYGVVIVAVSDFLVIGVDSRLANRATYLTTEGRAYLRAVAAAAAPYVLPTARLLFDANYTPMRGAGGRHFAILTTPELLQNASNNSWAGIAGDQISTFPQSECALSSELHATFYNAQYYPPNSRPGLLASVLVHEFAHQADGKTQRLMGANNGDPESYATAAQELAMRLALGQSTQARYDQLAATQPTEAGILITTWGRADARRLWDPYSGYRQGALYKLMQYEWSAQSDLIPKPTTFYQRVLARKPRWQSFRELSAAESAVLGIPVVDMLDRYALAALTDDLVEPTAAAAHGLPQLRSWNARSFPGQPTRLPRLGSVSRALQAGPGGYDAAYLMADGSDQGISLEILARAQIPMRLRLTRLR
jgi:uncharacterized protein YjdB